MVSLWFENNVWRIEYDDDDGPVDSVKFIGSFSTSWSHLVSELGEMGENDNGKW